MKVNLPIVRLALMAGLFSVTTTTLDAQKTPQQVQEQKQKVLRNAKVKSVDFAEDRLTPSFISLQKEGATRAAEAKNLLASLLETRQGVDELKEVRQVGSGAARKVIEYHQYFKGIKVDRARFTAFVQNDQVKFFNGAYYEIPGSAPTQPSLNEKAAVERAKNALNARKLYHEVLEEQFGAINGVGSKAALLAEILESMPRGELVYIKDFNKPEAAEMHLAYKFNIYSAEPFGRAWVYIDAIDGKLLLIDQIIKHVDGPNGTPTPSSIATTVQTRYAGTKTIYTKQISGNDPNSGLPLTSSSGDLLYTSGSPIYALIDETKAGTAIET